jgi:hypothetical protein
VSPRGPVPQQCATSRGYRASRIPRLERAARPSWDLGQIFKSFTPVLCSPPPRRPLAPPVVVEPDRHSLAAVVPGPAAPLRAIGAPRARAPVPASAAAVEPSPSRRAIVPGPAAPPQATVASSTAAVGELSPFLISQCSYPTYGCMRQETSSMDTHSMFCYTELKTNQIIKSKKRPT